MGRAMMWVWAAVCVAATGPGAAGVASQPVIRVGPFLQLATPTSVWVVWETDGGGESLVEYGPTAALGSSATGSWVRSSGTNRIHHTQVTGLTPQTTYHYRASTDGAHSEILHFRTPAEASAEQPFRFAALSDTQADGANPRKHEEIINEGIIKFVTSSFGPDIAEELAFVIEPGDLVNWGPNYEEWKHDYFDEAQNLYQHVPVYPVPGNHEGDSEYFFKYFRLPENGTPGYLEHWWYHDHGNVRIIGLDSNDAYRIQAQLDWLDGVLADAAANADIDFVFAQLHHPHKSEVWTPGNTPYVGEVVRRLEAFSTASGKPSAHFFGHTHAYSRGQSRDHDHLWVNVATGEGNVDYWGEYPIADYPEFQRSFVDWGFVLMEVEAGDDPRFTLTRISRGNEIEAKDNEVMDVLTVRARNQPPKRPAPVAPAAGAIGASPDALTLRAGGFADPDGDSHLESHFQVTTAPGEYTAPVVDEWIRFENWFAPSGASGPANGYYSVNTVSDPEVTKVEVEALAPEATHWWRVRYRDSSLGWSDWSEESSFTTGASRLGVNLLENPGAETGSGGWEVLDPPLESLAEGDCGATFAPAAGSRFFAVGGVCADGAYGEARQVVDVSGRAGLIDEGRAVASFGAEMRDWSGSDVPEIWVVFQDGGGGTLGASAKLSAQVGTWTQVRETVQIPMGSRKVALHISGTRNAGADNDSYFDKIFLRVGADDVCRVDLNGDGSLDFFDFLAFQTLFGAGDLGADFTGDGLLDLFDFLAFQNEFVAGCA